MSTVDFTRFRKGSKPRGRPIVVCPKCGRKGEVTLYRGKHGPWGQIIHEARQELFGFLVTTELCSFKGEEAERLLP